MNTDKQKPGIALVKAIGEKNYEIIKNLPEEEKRTITRIIPYLELANDLHQAFWLGNKNHETIYVNEIYEEISQYSLAECLGQQCDFCFTEESRTVMDKHHRFRKKGLTTQYEAEMISKGGTITPLLINGIPTKEGGSMGLFTNLALMEKLSHEEQRLLEIIGHEDIQIVKKTLKPDEIGVLFKYRHALEFANAMNHCFWIGGKSHKTIYANKIYRNLTEYSLEECIGQRADFSFTEESKKTIEKHHKLRAIGKSSQYEATYLTKSGKTIPLLVVGVPSKMGGSYGIHVDLREIQRFNRQEKITRQILKFSTEAIVILNPHRQVTLWNNGATKLFGYTEEEVLGKSIDIIIPQEAIISNKALVEEVDEKGQIQNREGCRMDKNGEIKDVLISVSKVLDEKNNLRGYLLIYRDVSFQKRANGELQKRFETIQDAYKELGLQRRHLDYLYEIIDCSVDHHSSLESLEKLIVSALCLLTKCDGTILRIHDEHRGILKLKACFGVDNKWLDKNQIKFGNSLAAEAFANNRPLILDDIDTNPKHQGLKLLKSHGFKTVVIIPLVINKKVLGSLSLYATEPAKFRMIETDFLEKIGRQCSIALFAKKHSIK